MRALSRSVTSPVGDRPRREEVAEEALVEETAALLSSTLDLSLSSIVLDIFARNSRAIFWLNAFVVLRILSRRLAEFFVFVLVSDVVTEDCKERVWEGAAADEAFVGNEGDVP